MKKGFTLIELLAVIVILSVILVIAVPQILDVISNTKTSAYVSNNKMVLKSAELYATNNNLLPTQLGSTVEIAVSDLKNNGYIRNIKLGNNDCNGYVSIKKIEESEYDYSPHINCELNISSSVEDKLVLHYKFNDFNEATYNISLIDGQSGISPFVGDGFPTLNIIDPIVTYENRRVVKFKPGSSNNFYFNGSSYLSTTISSTKWTSTLYIKRVDGAEIIGGIGTYMYVANNPSNDNLVVTPIPVGDGWYKIVRTRQGIVSGYPTLIGCYSLTSNTEYYIANWLIEPKSYATPFKNSLTSPLVKNYSTTNYNSLLSYTTTPKYIDGTYIFDGTSQINLPNDVVTTQLIRDNGITYSIWIKPNSLSDQRIIGQQISLGYSDYSTGGLAISASGKAQMITYSDANPSGYLYLVGNTSLEINKWYHVVGVYDNTTSQLKLYVNGKKDATPISVGTFSRLLTNSSNRIGNRDNSTSLPYNGSIDNIRIYNRVLSDNEVNQLYELEKNNI